MAGGVAIFDYNNDGFPDIFFANGADIRTLKKSSPKHSNRLFENDDLGGFRDVTQKSGLAGIGYDNGVAIGDYDNDGFKDIFVGGVHGNRLYHNNGNGTFTDATVKSSMTRLSISMAGYSPTIADFDNDGWNDIFVTRGHVQPLDTPSRIKVEQPNTIFANLGKAGFRALTAEAGLTAQPPRRHRGSAVGDLNRDGRLDVVVSALSAPAEIWENDSPGGNHWLELDLEGTRSNRDGIGARIKVAAAGTVQYNHVSFAVGHASSSAGPAHFGLGRSESADLVEIRWPSGIVQGLKNVAADRVVKVKEPAK
jgi:hypothetical protein